MNEKFTLTGGARIGRANITYPFANLTADKNALIINASIVGNLIFQPKDVLSIEPYKANSMLLGKGLQIHHRVKSYNATVIFWTSKDPSMIINELKHLGFWDQINGANVTTDPEIAKRQQQGSSPIKKPVAIVFIVLWNLLFLSDIIAFFIQDKKEGLPFGNGVKLAIGLVMASAIMALVSGGFRKIVLKEGRELEDVKKFLYFILFIGGFMLLNLTIFSAIES